MQEVWKDIAGYEGLYQVSNLGEVRSIDRYVAHPSGSKRLYPGRILKPSYNGDGYLFVDLSKEGMSKGHRINRLVAEAFIPNPNKYEVINHIDHNRVNNSVDNLEWCTVEYNSRYSSNKCVQQFNRNGEFIAEWEAASDASRNLGINPSNIIQCCKGNRKTAGGYIWRYKEAE